MCGIGAILRTHPPGASTSAPDAIPDAWLHALDASIAHRGPHGAGTFRDRVRRADGSIVEVALVHRRLSILDHQGGAQPMVHREYDALGHEHAIAIVFNGCVYNHRALRNELVALGRPFRSDHSDTEVLLQGWIAWGPSLFERVVGMVACVIWDARTPTLVAMRNWPGEKPLYSTAHFAKQESPKPKEPALLAYASSPAGLDELRQLAGLPQSSPNPTLTRVDQWLALGYDTSSTPFGPISGDNHTCQFFAPPTGASEQREQSPDPLFFKDTPALDQAIERAIIASVHARLDADVPLGCLLSGGVDSSLIAAIAAKAHPKLTTVCVRMPSKAYDESTHAQAVASHIGSTHHTIDVSPKPAEDLVWLIERLGLPFGDSSLLPTYWACMAAREHVGVALTGDGGDELFFGYERYKAANVLHRWSWLLARIPMGLLHSSNPKSRRDKLRRLVLAAREGTSRNLAAIFPTSMLEALIGPPPKKEHERAELLDADMLRRHDLTHALPGDMLRKVDHASLAAGLEVRAPLLDQQLFDSVSQLTSRELMPAGELKGLLKAIARRHVPAVVIDRPKMGFAIPLGDWFRDDFGALGTLLRDTLASADPFPTSLLGLEINRRYVHQLLDEHMQSRQDHAQRLYMLLVLALWCRQTLDRRRRLALTPTGLAGPSTGYRPN